MGREAANIAQRPIPLHFGRTEFGVGDWRQVAKSADEPPRFGLPSEGKNRSSFEVMAHTGERVDRRHPLAAEIQRNIKELGRRTASLPDQVLELRMVGRCDGVERGMTAPE